MNNNLIEKSVEKFTGKKWNEISESEQKILLEISGVPMDYVNKDKSCIIEFTGTPLFISGYFNGIDKNPTPNADAIITSIEYVDTEKMQKFNAEIENCIALMDEAVDFGTCSPEEYDSIVEEYNRLITERDALLSQASAVSAENNIVTNPAISKYNIVPLSEPKNNVVAVASATFYNSLTVNNITINVNQNGELFVRMPQKRTNQGNFIDVAHPLSRDGRKNINETLLNGFKNGEYKKTFFVNQEPSISAQNSVKYPDGKYGNNLARLDVVVNDMVIHNAKIFKNKDGMPQLALPSYKGKNGYTSICVPSSSEVFKAMNTSAVEEFNTEYRFIDCTNEQVTALKNGGLHINSNINSDGVNIVKFKAADEARVQNILNAANAIHK